MTTVSLPLVLLVSWWSGLARLDWQRALIVSIRLFGAAVVFVGVCVLVGWAVGRWRCHKGKDPYRGNRPRRGKWNGRDE